MNRVLFTAQFRRKIKPLSKKYRTLKESINHLASELTNNPFLGDSYGKNIYKVRLADESKGKGKSGGFRVMYYLAVKKADNIDVLLMTVFDKSEQDTLTKKDAEQLFAEVLAELK